MAVNDYIQRTSVNKAKYSADVLKSLLGNTIGGISKSLLYNPDNKRVFPASPVYASYDIDKMKDGEEKLEATKNLAMDLGLMMSGGVKSIKRPTISFPKSITSKKTPSITKLYHGTSEIFDIPKSMRQLIKSDSNVKPSNVGGRSPFVHLSENREIANNYAKARAFNMSGNPSVKKFLVKGNILDLTKHQSSYTKAEKSILLKMGQELKTLSNGRGPDGFIGGELSMAGKIKKHSMDYRDVGLSFTDIENSNNFSKILEKYGFSGFKFSDRKIYGGYENTVAMLPSKLELP